MFLFDIILCKDIKKEEFKKNIFRCKLLRKGMLIKIYCLDYNDIIKNEWKCSRKNVEKNLHLRQTTI